MKTIISGALFATTIFIGVNVPSAQALSCLDPQGMIEYYVNTDDYSIFTAEAGETKEYVKKSADPKGVDPNRQFSSGYTGQYVEVSEVHKGYTEDKQWVYFQKDSTWGYLCAGGPAEEGIKTLYIINQPNGMFELPRVVNSYPADTPLALDILSALAESETDTVPSISDTSSADQQNRLRFDMMEMLFILKVKLGELRWWIQ